jgi:hypothetical protein
VSSAPLTRRERLSAADSVLLIHNSQYPSPPDVAEGVRAFRRYSRFPVFSVDASLGFPRGLDRVAFGAIVLHFTMFYADLAPITEPLRRHLSESERSVKVAFFQDEQSYLPTRLAFCSEFEIDCVYTCLEPPDSHLVYGPTGVSQIETYLPGYVSERLVLAGSRYSLPDAERPVDVGYRGRAAPASWRGAAVEKAEIGIEFKQRAADLDLILDVETDESKRIYGRAWPRFIGRCKAVLGTESGATIPYDGTHDGIPYRTISPRHFEAAALRSTQILYEGRYSDVMRPMVHYIPLKKDFSNFDEVIESFETPEVRRELASNAYQDLVASGTYTYRRLIARLDEQLEALGLHPAATRAPRKLIASTLYPRRSKRMAMRARRAMRAAVRVAANRARRRPATSPLRRPHDGLNDRRQ